MGQTLTHGIYLPDEGERNCYNGLAANWQLLDTSVGTIAEHTTALSGKAPLVHTHGKADITDLLNSDFIPSANNSYDLGSSSYQWNNLYAKNYYYNGVAWGLGQANVWTQNNRIQAFLEMQYIASGGYSDIRWFDENNVNCCTFRQSANFLTIGKKYTSKSSWYDGAQILITASGAVIFKGYDGANTQSAAFTYDSFYPEQNNAINLGTSTNKWKTLNGCNPGALSLPKNANSASYNIDTTNWTTDGSIITYTPLLDGWLYINARNDDTNGDSFIVFDDAVSSFGTSVFGNKGLQNNGAGLLCLMMPVNKNNGINIRIKSPGIISARLYPCNGNV